MSAIRLLLWLFGLQAILCCTAELAIELRPALLPATVVNCFARLFAQGQIVLSFIALAAILRRNYHWRWLGDFSLLYVLTLIFESAGTAWGILFGSYRFTGMLGIRWFGLVPALIPLAWFNIVISSFLTAALLFRDRVGRIVGGSVLMLAWDICADPVMGYRFPFWIWRGGGSYYGIPLSNFAGWFLIGLATMTWLNRRSWIHSNEECDPLFMLHYSLCMFIVMGSALIYRLNFALLLSVAIVLIVLAAKRRISSKQCESEDGEG